MNKFTRTTRSIVLAGLAWLAVVAPAVAAILVDFDQDEYYLPTSASPLTVGVVIDADDSTPGLQPLADGLFSVGFKVEFLDVKAEVASPSAVVVADPLNNFDFGAGAEVTVGPGEATLRGNVAIATPGEPAQPYTDSGLAEFTLNTLAAPTGTYQLSLDFYKPLGPAEDSFVDGLGATLDSQIVFGSALVTVGLPGDYNQNGVVESADYTVWRGAVGSAVDLTADGDGDGVVGDGDYEVWRENYGAVASPMAAAAPEPATGAMAVAAAALAALARRRRDA